VRQYIAARTDLLRYRGGNALDDAPIAEAAPMGRFFFEPAEVPFLCAVLRQVFRSQADHIVLQAEKICRHRFDLLGYENLDYGVEIDWHSDAVHGKRAPRKPWFQVKYLEFTEVGDSKITWELNRHQHFVTLAKAYWLTGEDKFVHEIFAQWSHWHKQNPYPVGINWASSLEVAYRSLAWVWTFFLLQECPLFTSDLRRQWQSALRLSGRHIETYLSTYFSPNTHLLGEALALFFLGTLFHGLRSARRWQRRGREILEREAAKQVKPDGFYFEQSTYYHVYAVDIFLHGRILGTLNEVPMSPEFDQILQRMLNALSLLGRAGLAPKIGDDDGGRLFDPRRNRAEHMLDPLATGAVLFRRGDFKFAAGGPREETLWLLGREGLAEFDSLPSLKPSAASTDLPDSGIYLMADERFPQQLLIDAGPLGAGNGGHAHADALSICLVQNARDLLLDPGTFEYVGESGERARLRGTGAHSTMQVDGRDQADATGPFSWESPPLVRAEKWITGQQFDLFQGSHDGYSRLTSPVIHHRWVFHRKGKFWMVRDLAEGHGSHQLDIAWHIGPTMSPASAEEYLFSGEEVSLALLAPEGHGWSQSVTRDHWSPAYGRAERLSVLTFGAKVELPADFATLLIAGQNPQPDLGRFVRIDGSRPGTVCAYRYSNPQQEHIFFFADRSGPWTLGTWASDADFLYLSFDRKREEYTLLLCNGSHADAAGRRVLTCGKRVSYAEVLSGAMRVEICSSDPEQIVLQQPLDRVWAETNLDAPGNGPKGMGA
jgi:Heparinase II/III-like protein/Heparinase II/III N-terminus